MYYEKLSPSHYLTRSLLGAGRCAHSDRGRSLGPHYKNDALFAAPALVPTLARNDRPYRFSPLCSNVYFPSFFFIAQSAIDRAGKTGESDL